MLTMSTVLDFKRPGRMGQAYFGYFANPYGVTRTILLAMADVAQELYFSAQQRRRDIRPRIKRSLSYALVRAWATVIQRDLQVQVVRDSQDRSVKGNVAAIVGGSAAAADQHPVLPDARHAGQWRSGQYGQDRADVPATAGRVE